MPNAKWPLYAIFPVRDRLVRERVCRTRGQPLSQIPQHIQAETINMTCKFRCSYRATCALHVPAVLMLPKLKA